MKNKKLLYILIPGTLLVWGLILYRIFAPSQGADVSPVQSAQFVPSADNEILNDTFSIHTDYRDPFSGKVAQKKAAVSVIPKSVKPAAVATPWPAIVYGGIIKNQKSNKQLALVQINGAGYTMKLDEVINEVQLTKIFRDSIEVKFQKMKKFISK